MGQNGGMPQTGLDTPTADTAEMVYISSLALLKMLKHGRLNNNTRSCRSTDGSYGSYAWRICR
jgi:hypothetical protein